MNFFQLSTLISALVSFSIGQFVFFSQPSRKVNQTFLFLTLIATFWQLSLWEALASKHEEALVFWIRSASAFAALIPPSMNMIRLSILYPAAPPVTLVKANRLWMAIAATVMLLSLSPFFLQGASLPLPGHVIGTPHYGPGFLLFTLYFLSSFGALFFLLLKASRTKKGVKKTEIQYLLLSCSASLFVGVFFLIVPNITGLIDLGAGLPLSVMVFSVITAYGIATRGILDVAVICRRVTAYGILTGYLILIYLAGYGLSNHVLLELDYTPGSLPHIIAAFLMALSVSWAQGWTRHFTNRLFLSQISLDVGQILKSASKALNRVFTVEELCDCFQTILHENLETQDLKIFIRDQHDIQQIFPTDGSRVFSEKSPLPQWLHRHASLCVRDLLPRQKETTVSIEVLQELKQQRAAAAIGIYRNEQLSGFMLLGCRTSGRLYTLQEALAVEGLRDLFAVSYENACLYTELQNNRIYMDQLLKNLLNGVLATKEDGTISTCNAEASRILNRSADLLPGKHYHQLPQDLSELLDEVYRKDIVVKSRELVLPGNGEQKRQISAGASLFRDSNGNVLGSLLVLQDRSTLRRLEEQVKRSERLASLGILSAGMAHEIKNPLATLQTFTQLLPERHEDQDYRETFFNLAGKEISRIDGLVNKLLTLARPPKLNLKLLSLHELLRDYLKIFRQQAENTGIIIKETYTDGSDLISADPDQLRQVLLNLLLNAQQAMPSGGEIQLSTHSLSDKIEMVIQDSGEGISLANQVHMFDPFFTTKSAGTGLGLAVAHHILQEHQADIRVESQPGEGCSFLIQFPLSKTEIAS